MRFNGSIKAFQHLVICLGSGWTSHPSSNKRVVVVYRRPSNVAIANKMNVNPVRGRGQKGSVEWGEKVNRVLVRALYWPASGPGGTTFFALLNP